MKRNPWLGAALALAAAGWGSNQFAPLLWLYRSEIPLSTAAVEAAFGTYALGLAPGLLVGGPLADRYGRRPIVGVALAGTLLASLLLAAASLGVGWLFAGRLMIGLAGGAVFGAGAAWMKELSAGSSIGPRRAAVAMTIGFAGGPLVAGMIAQLTGGDVLPYAPHVVLTVVALLAWRRTPETVTTPSALVFRLRTLRNPQFSRIVLPAAPWIFGSATIAFAYLPGLVALRVPGMVIGFAAVITCATALSGIFAQSLARRLAADPVRLLALGLCICVFGLLLGAAAALWLLVPLVAATAVVLGAGYGFCLVGALTETQRLAEPGELAAATALCQAAAYAGLTAPYLLAALGGGSPPVTLLVVALLCALTLGWVLRPARAGIPADTRK